jgi:hypothetical protein
MPQVPSLFDRADGKGGREGVALPARAIFVNSEGTQFDITDPDYALKLMESVNSPEIERGEQCTVTHEFLTDYNNACNRLALLGRGTLLVSEDGDVSRVLSAKIRSEKAGMATLTVVSESVSFDTPPDEFQCPAVELGVHIIKHPRYFGALNPASTDYTNYLTVNDIHVSLSDIKQTIIRAIQAYMDAPIFPSENNINGYFHTNVMGQMAHGAGIDFNYRNPSFNPELPQTTYPNGTGSAPKWSGKTTDIASLPDGNFRSFVVTVPSATVLNSPGVLLAQAAAREIIEKIWRQEEQPYIIGFEMKWTVYYFRPPMIHPGGVIEDPIDGQGMRVPDYFISPYYPPNLSLGTVFDWLPTVNPQCYSITGKTPGIKGTYGIDYQISWLRKSDDVEYQRTWFKVTRTWMGAPIGMWDQQLYSSGPRPSKPTDYITSFVSLTP